MKRCESTRNVRMMGANGQHSFGRCYFLSDLQRVQSASVGTNS